MKKLALFVLATLGACGPRSGAPSATRPDSARSSFQPIRVDLRVESGGDVVAEPRLTTTIGEAAAVRVESDGGNVLEIDAIVTRDSEGLLLRLAVAASDRPAAHRTLRAPQGQPVTWEVDDLRVIATLQPVTIYRSAFWFHSVPTDLQTTEGAVHPALGDSGGPGSSPSAPRGPLPLGTGH